MERTFAEGLKQVERPTNIRDLAAKLGVSEITASKYVAVLSAKGKIKTKKLGGQVLIL